MTGFDILFETDRFSASEVGERFINPCCFGEDLAEWLRQQLPRKELSLGTPYQEDWGWEMLAQEGSRGYYLGVGGDPKDGAVGKNDGEGRIMLEKKSSIRDKLRRSNRMIKSEPIHSHSTRFALAAAVQNLENNARR